MFGVTSLTGPARLERSLREASSAGVATVPRRIALLRSGRRHGPLTRLITPWDIGELTQPFVFLGYFEHTAGEQMVVGAQPGIATLTLVLSGALEFEGAAGNTETIVAGGFKWTTPGEFVCHGAGGATGEPVRAFQLWLELAPSTASTAGASQCVAPHEVHEEGPVRVVLGELGRARGPLAYAPTDINYLHVRLRDRQCWSYAAPAAHNVTWLAVDRGGLRLPEDGRVSREEIVLFGDSRGVIEVQADGECSFVLGSAPRLTNALLRGGRPADRYETAGARVAG